MLIGALQSCDDDDVTPTDSISFLDECEVWFDGTFQEITLDVEPQFIDGGEDGFLEHVYLIMKYPAEARENSIQGLAYSSFEISEEGVVENVQDAGSEFEILGNAALEPLLDLEGQEVFEPAILDGQPVRVRKTLKVRFKLE